MSDTIDMEVFVPLLQGMSDEKFAKFYKDFGKIFHDLGIVGYVGGMNLAVECVKLQDMLDPHMKVAVREWVARRKADG